MTFKKRFGVVGALVVLALASAGLGAPTASAQESATVTVANGAQIVAQDRQQPEMSQPFTDYFCTLGAVGTDKYGRSIGISAGHCWGAEEDALSGVGIPDDILPIYLRHTLDWRPGGNDLGNDPIGYVRFFQGDPDGPAGEPGHSGKDYSIIEFVDGVVLSSQGPHIKMVGINEIPLGSINSPYATLPALPNEKVLNTGIFTNHQLITSGQLGVQYGRITNNAITGVVGSYQSHAAHRGGDSGGPAVLLAPGAALPSAANNYQTTGVWVGLTKAIIIGLPPYNYTSSANVLADLRTRDLASGQDGTVHGAGFQVTQNP